MRIPLPSLAVLAMLCLPASLAADPEDGEVLRIFHSFALSPDGSEIVVAWRDDLWRASTGGGEVQPLTRHPAVEREPCFSRDGTQIAFISDRSGSRQVYVAEHPRGTPRRVSTHTQGFSLHGFAPGGEALLVRSALGEHWRHDDRLFLRPLDEELRLQPLFEAQVQDAALSPEGGHVAVLREGVAWFRKGYVGPRASQLWIVDRASGEWTRYGPEDRGIRWPMWSADGQVLWHASEEDGTWNLWSLDLATGKRRQHTHFEDVGIERATISADGKTIAFTRGFDLHVWRTQGEASPRRLILRHRGDTSTEDRQRRELDRASQAAFTEDAKEIAFISGGDVFVMDTELREPVRVTDTPWHESDPLFSPDHDTLYFVGERDGQVDVFACRRADPERWWWQNDEFGFEVLQPSPAVERGLRLMPGGEHIAFLSGRGDLRRMRLDGSEPETLLESWDEPEFDFSPDGKWIVYAVDDDDFNRDVWIAPLDGHRPPFNLSLHPDYDGEPRWSPDGRLVAFRSARWDDEIDIHYVWLREEDAEQSERDRRLAKALERMQGRDPGPGDPDPDPPPPGEPFDPSGRWSGSLEGDAPVPPEGLALLLVISQQEDGSYRARLSVQDQLELEGVEVTWEENRVHLEATTQLGLLRVEGERTGDRIEGTWSLDTGLAGTFELQRERPAEVPAAAETPEEDAEGEGAEEEAAEEEAVEVRIDWDGLARRVERLRIDGGSEQGLFFSPDGKRLAFEASVGGRRGTYTVTFPDELKPDRLTSDTGEAPRWIEEKRILWLSGGRPALLSGSKNERYDFKIWQEIGAGARYAAAYEACWRLMRDHWYDPRHNGRDWEAIGERYRPFARLCRTPNEIYMVVNRMLGELNGSHLGFSLGGRSYDPPGWKRETGHLGISFDRAAGGPGLLISAVLPDSPADLEGSLLRPGERLLRIEGVEIGPDSHLVPLLTRRSEAPLDLEVSDAEGETRRVSIVPVGARQISRLRYEAWLEENRRRVDAWSEGALGYLHIRSMNWSSFQRFEEELFEIGHGKDGLIIDVRDNGGGFTTDHLLTCLTQPEHAITVPRGGGPGYPQGRMVYATWRKPIVVLCNQNSFSNAEIFSHAIQVLGRGRIVGVQTAGGVISTGSARVMDFARLRIPFRGWFRADDGRDMELAGCVPDIVVWPRPGEIEQGVDPQLEAAAAALREDVAAWKQRPRPELQRASER